jgi:hypothetical protein
MQNNGSLDPGDRRCMGIPEKLLCSEKQPIYIEARG